MTDDLGESLDKLRKATPDLDATADQANTLFERVETILSDECHVNVSHSVPLDDAGGEQGAPKTVRHLCYEQVEGKYCIAIRTNEYDGQDNLLRGEIRVWSECSRDDRLRAIYRLTELVEGVTQRVLTSTHDAQQAMQGLEEGLEAIRKFKNAGKID